jgi:hypothetical protein
MAERNRNLGTFEFNPYAAGSKTYGQGMKSPTMGPVDKTGYAERDRKLQVRRNALQAKLKAKGKGAYASSDSMRFN